MQPPPPGLEPLAALTPLRPVSHDHSGDPGVTTDAAPSGATPPSSPAPNLPEVEPVSQEELNAWRRGLTPQAEIWNGRLAMLGLSMGLGVLLIVRLVGHHG